MRPYLTNPYASLLDSLFVEPINPSQSAYYLSAYLNLDGFNSHRAKQEIQSHLRAAFRQHKELAPLSALHTEVIDQIKARIDHLNGAFMAGLIILAKISPLLSSPTQGEISDIIVLTSSSVITRVTIDRVYNCDQILRLARVSPDALIIELISPQASIWQLKENELTLLSTIKNKFIDFDDTRNDYIEKMSLGTTQQVYQGTGSDKIADKIKREHLVFLHDLSKELTRSKNIPHQFHQVVIYYSNNFRDWIDNFTATLIKHFKVTWVLTKENHINNGPELKTDVDLLISTSTLEWEYQAWQLAREEFQKYTEDPSEIMTSLENGRVRVLFLHPFLPIKNSQTKGRDQRALTAWLAGKSQAEVYFLPENETLPLAASLRY